MAWSEKAPVISQDELKKIIEYDPGTGVFTWRPRTPEMFKDGGYNGAVLACKIWNGKFSNKPAGSLNKDGYMRILISRYSFKAHRLAWLYMTGAWPEADIDHADLDRSNNKWLNLRSATRSQNLANTRPNKRSTTGAKGVSFKKKTGRYAVSIRSNGKRYHVGYADTVEEGSEMYEQAAIKLFGEFARVV